MARVAEHKLIPGARAARVKDLKGQVYGRLTVTGWAGYEVVGIQRRPAWKCRCTCGTALVVVTKALVDGKTRSCGCGRRGTTTDETPRPSEGPNRVERAAIDAFWRERRAPRPTPSPVELAPSWMQ